MDPGWAAIAVVERTFAWLHSFKRLLVRYERRADMHEGFLAIACCLICSRRLLEANRNEFFGLTTPARMDLRSSSCCTSTDAAN